MKLQKHQKMMVRAMQKKWPQLNVQITAGSKHPKIIAQYAAVRIQVAVASTPACAEQSIAHSLQLVRRRFAVAGISLSRANTH